MMQAARVKCGRSEDENGCVDEECEAQGESRIENGVTDGLAALARFGTEGARLHEARMEIEIVRHNGGAEDTDCDVKHFAVTENVSVRQKTVGRFEPERPGEKDFVSEATANRKDESDNKGLEHAEAAALEQEDKKNV